MNNPHTNREDDVAMALMYVTGLVAIGKFKFSTVAEKTDKSTLELLQDFVEGPIEVLEMVTPDGNPSQLIFNGEGKNLGLPINNAATKMARDHVDGFLETDFLVGDVILVSMKKNGESILS